VPDLSKNKNSAMRLETGNIKVVQGCFFKDVLSLLGLTRRIKMLYVMSVERLN